MFNVHSTKIAKQKIEIFIFHLIDLQPAYFDRSYVYAKNAIVAYVSTELLYGYLIDDRVT